MRVNPHTDLHHQAIHTALPRDVMPIINELCIPWEHGLIRPRSEVLRELVIEALMYRDLYPK